jgi:hypothetical protein
MFPLFLFKKIKHVFQIKRVVKTKFRRRLKIFFVDPVMIHGPQFENIGVLFIGVSTSATGLLWKLQFRCYVNVGATHFVLCKQLSGKDCQTQLFINELTYNWQSLPPNRL